MPDTRAPTVPQFTRRLGIETPEHLVLELELAGLGSRMAATVCDAGLLTLAYVLLGVGIQLLPTPTGGDAEGPWSTLAAIVLILTVFLLFWGYFLLFEALNDGRTPGKRLMGIRVLMDTGHPLTFTAAAVRNLVRIVDMQPLFTYQVGLAFVLFHAQNKRLGDIVAGTVVVRDRPENLQLASVAADRVAPEALEAGPPELADEEFRLLDQLLERLQGLEGAVRHRLTAELVARFAPRFPRRDPDPETFLVRLHGAELAKRRGRLAARRGQGVGRTSVAAERFVMQKREGWETFRALAARAERLGLKQLGAAEIPGFAAQYREVASDLARARTYGVDPRVLEYLERVVSAGHNALYGRHTGQRVPIVRLALRELPAAVVEARAFVLAALLLFALPAVTGYLAIRERPAIAEEVLPDEMIARARAGAGRRAEGVGYAEAPSMYLPVVASRIITNNVQVAFFAFAFGITAGIGTLLLLTLNGLFFGAVLGLFANYGLAGWLLTFVAGHGVLELTAIFIAGGAGLLVARGLIAPGDLTRRDALVLAGQRAARLVAASVLLLCLAGTIEGLLSASDAAPAYKFAVSGASAVLLACYFASGWTYLRRRASTAAPAAAATGATGTSPR